MSIWDEALNRAASVMRPYLEGLSGLEDINLGQDLMSGANLGIDDPWLAALASINLQSRDPLSQLDLRTRQPQIRTAQIGAPTSSGAPTTAAPSVSPQPQVAFSAMSSLGTPADSDILKAGQRYYGKPYVWGGGRDGGTDNFDCSSFVSRAVLDGTGKRLTPFTDAIFTETNAVAPQDAQIGDIILWEWNDPDQPGVRFSHTGIYAGGDKILHSTSPGGVQWGQIGQMAGRPIFRRVR